MNGVAIAKKEQRQRSTLKDELRRLSDQVEAAKRRLEGYKFDQAAHEKLVTLLGDLRAQKDALLVELRSLERRQKKADSDLVVTERKLTKVRETLAELEGGDTQARHAGLLAEIERLEKERDALLAAKRAGFKQEISEMAKDTAEAQRVLASLNTAIGKAHKELSSMSADQKKHKALLADIDAAHTTLEELGKTIRAREKELVKKRAEVDATQADIDRRRKEFDEECHKKDVAIKLREKDLVEREGDCNRKEQWFKERGALLRKAKQEIEQFHGRILKHIIIPED